MAHSNHTLKINDRGLALIMLFEGLRTEAYLCPGGVWTIGYGHTRGVREGDTCTERQAEAWLREDCERSEAAVALLCKVPLTSDQFSALVSFVFNIGAGAFMNSTLLLLLNEGDYYGAGRQFERWNKSNGKIQRGLVRRRAAERALFEGNYGAN